MKCLVKNMSREGVPQQNCGFQGYACFCQLTTGILLCSDDLSMTSNGFGAYEFVFVI